MSSGGQRDATQATRSSRRASVWLRLLTAAVFAFYVNYLPFHLIGQPHSHDGAEAAMIESEHHHDPNHDGHGDHHVPHPASEHWIDMLPKSGSLFLCLAFLPPISVAVPEPPESQVILVLAEQILAPGESPPEPSQPRAPPLG